MHYPSPYGRYTLLESIGKGGMSAIDLAQTSVSDAQYLRFVVIKRMQAKFTQEENFVMMFKDEARINAELHHNKIAQVFDFGQQEDEYYIVMEYIPGVDLRILQRELAKKARGIPIRVTLRILTDVCEALYYAHTRLDTYGRPMNVVHRDVNPRNIMISNRGEVKLIDFGVAKADNRLDETVGHTLKGKFAYMSPEQIEGGKVDGRADLFAVGLTLHELIDGRRPFAGLNEVQIMHRVLSGNIPALMGPKDHPQPELVQAVHECSLALSAADRYPTAGHMQQALLHAARPCGGVASDAEMAAFLREIMPLEMQSISQRLDRYRKEITQPNGLVASFDSSISQDAPTDFFPHRQNDIPPPPNSLDYPTAVIAPSQEETLVNEAPARGRWRTSLIALVSIGVLVLAGTTIALINKNNTGLTNDDTKGNPGPSPVVTERAGPKSIERTQTTENQSDNGEEQIKSDSPNPILQTTPQTSTNEEKQEDENQTAPSSTGQTTQKSTTTNAAVQHQASEVQPSQVENPTNGQQEQTASTPNQQNGSQAQHTSNATEEAQPFEEENNQQAPTITEPVELTYIFITSMAGQTGIVVKMDGTTIGTLNGPFRTKVPVGEHTFLFSNPSNGREFRQTSTISKSSQNLISIPEL